ncbi:tetratricopeptide repeat protein [Lysobacter claricitrinus]|uniref:tetratricopeptide repeat protein n=1 Tax=Lysobacter claricitrinus TaxID=3367728 RepID=UPI0037DBDBCF
MKRHVIAIALLSAVTSVANAAPAFDAAKAWSDFFSRGAYDEVNKAYQVLGDVGYDGVRVDADGCRDAGAALDKAIDAAPVGIALRHAALLCAETRKDAVRADRELNTLGALTRYAVERSGHGVGAPPLRVVRPEDVMAFVSAAGYEERYAYYASIHVNRYYPRTVVVFDRETGLEQQLEFDWVDTLAQLTSDSKLRGYPVDRFAIAHAFLDSWSGDDTASADALSARAAWGETDVHAKRDQLKGGAARGGLLSIQSWLELCSEHQFDGCADGLVDALLPLAEKGHALARTDLALAYLRGIGVKADEASARTLLESADRTWAKDGGSVLVGAVMLLRGEKWPAWLAERVTMAEKAGNPQARAIEIVRRADAAKAMPTGADRAFLEAAENNRTGRGLDLLASLAEAVKSPEADALRERAALAGDPESMRVVATRRMRTGTITDATNAMLRDAAIGGDDGASQVLAYRSLLARDYDAAHYWLSASVIRGNVDALMMLAGMKEQNLPGAGTAEEAAQTYEQLAPELPAARRALSAMLIDGRGVKPDPVRARRLLEQDANRGDAKSQLQLASALMNGAFGKADASTAVAWLQKAASAGSADAKARYGIWLLAQSSPAERSRGLSLLREADAAGSELATNDLAWRLCVSSDAAVRDPKAGLSVAQRLGDVRLLQPGHRDTVAACHAAGGNYAEASRVQSLALDALPAGTTFDATRKGMQARLDLYKAGKPYIESDAKQL